MASTNKHIKQAPPTESAVFVRQLQTQLFALLCLFLYFLLFCDNMERIDL